MHALKPPAAQQHATPPCAPRTASFRFPLKEPADPDRERETGVAMEMAQEGGAHGEPAAAAGPESPLSPPLSPATAAAAALQNARWNPTREQVTVLEGLYDQHGLRTPSADQIQRITARLREHGPVEAKNVFYWFQNHKARQRQKQKQDSFAYFSRLMRRPPPLPVIVSRPPGQQPYPLGRMPPASPLPAACNSNGGGAGTHVMYRTPYYMPTPPPQASPANAAGGYYNLQQAAHHMAAAMYPRMEIAVQDKQMQNLGSVYKAAPYDGTSNQQHVVVPSSANGGGADGGESADHAGRTRETLELFPLRPTFLLPAAARGASLTSPPAPPSASASFSRAESKAESLVDSPNSDVEPLPFYDFLGLQSAGR